MGSGYEISVKDVGQILQSLDGQLGEFLGALADLGRLSVPTVGYGQVGGTAAQGSTTSQQQLVTSLQARATVLHKLNERIRSSDRVRRHRPAVRLGPRPDDRVAR